MGDEEWRCRRCRARREIKKKTPQGSSLPALFDLAFGEAWRTARKRTREEEDGAHWQGRTNGCKKTRGSSLPVLWPLLEFVGHPLYRCDSDPEDPNRLLVGGGGAAQGQGRARCRDFRALDDAIVYDRRPRHMPAAPEVVTTLCRPPTAGSRGHGICELFSPNRPLRRRGW